MPKGKCSNETDERKRIEKIRAARKRRFKALGYLNTDETRRKISASKKGKPLAENHRQAISMALKGRHPRNLGALHASRKGSTLPQVSGENSGTWKGDDVGYSGIHQWLYRHYGSPHRCELCNRNGPGIVYEWASKDGTARRNRDRYLRLCRSCHRKHDKVTPWNKGKKVQSNTGRTHIKPGQHISKRTEFKPGMIPHNKHLEPKPCRQCGSSFQPRQSIQSFCCRGCYWESMKTSKAIEIKET